MTTVVKILAVIGLVIVGLYLINLGEGAALAYLSANGEPDDV